MIQLTQSWHTIIALISICIFTGAFILHDGLLHIMASKLIQTKGEDDVALHYKKQIKIYSTLIRLSFFSVFFLFFGFYWFMFGIAFFWIFFEAGLNELFLDEPKHYLVKTNWGDSVGVR